VSEVEVWAELVGGNQSKRKHLALVAHNTEDFSEPNGVGESRIPTLPACSRQKSTYWSSLVNLIKEADFQRKPPPNSMMIARSRSHDPAGLGTPCSPIWGLTRKAEGQITMAQINVQTREWRFA
jgi:hypothetical protein